MTATAVRYRFGRFELQPDEHRLLSIMAPVHMGAHAIGVLTILVERAGLLVTKDELLRRVWGQIVVAENTLQVHISALRKVLGPDSIATISGRGYRFTMPVVRLEAPRAPTARAHNLPHDLTTFIGRDHEIAELAQLLGRSRLLTLSGSGGCGKTRLAIRLARDHVHAFPDGVWLVELAALNDAALLAQAIAVAFGLKEKPGEAVIDTIAAHVSPRALLLVLDNVEHLIEPCAHLAEALLRRCENLTILATSRERLAVAGEQTFRVPSLSVPDEHRDTELASIQASESARLFIERARLQNSRFAITAQNAVAIASICRRLDGIALALELAAARVRTLSVEDLSARLDQRFEVLTEGTRTAMPRHRTLRALIDWSHELLTDAEKAVFRRVAVFSGGWTPEAARQVCLGDASGPASTLELLDSLANKNLIVVDSRDGTRFGMLETVRHYALERLRESNEEMAARDSHLVHFMREAELLNLPHSDEELATLLNQLEADHENLRASLTWCESASANVAKGLYLSGKLYWFWRARGHFTEGRSWIGRLCALAPNEMHGIDRARALSTAGTLAYLQGDYVEAEEESRRALAIWEELANQSGITTELGNLGNIALNRGDYQTARQLFERALSIAREGGERRHVLVLLQNLASIVHELGDPAGAQTLLEECLPMSREVGTWSAAEVLGQLGLALQAQGQLAAARDLLTEALEGQREFGNRQGIAKMLVWLAVVSREAGDIPAARSQLREALTIQREVGDRIYMAAALEALAETCQDSGSPTDAALFWGQAESLREEIGTPQTMLERSRRERMGARARADLQDDAAFDLAWERGRLMALEEALRGALEA